MFGRGEKIQAHEIKPGDALCLEGAQAAWLGGTEIVVQRATFVRWEGNGDGTAHMIARNARGQEQYCGIYTRDQELHRWPH